MPIEPRDHAETVALFRHSLIGPLALQSLSRGQLAEELRRISQQRFRLPDSDNTRSFSVVTLYRWVRALRRGGLQALQPKARGDRGRGQTMPQELRTLLCDIRREYPDVTVSLMLANLRALGKIGPEVKASTVRRMLNEQGLSKRSVDERSGPRTRLRWQAERPGLLWHGDVCHGPTLHLDGKSVPVRIHALLDDASRYVVALRVCSDERETTMLALLASAVLGHGVPEVLYLDNGSTYRGDSLSMYCARLKSSLLHARPYDPQARGKMERFWRTMRSQVLDHLGQVGSLKELEQMLLRWVSRFYHHAPHAGLMGQSPQGVYEVYRATLQLPSPAEVEQALLVRIRRRVRRDCTLDVAGTTYEVPLSFLAGQSVVLTHSLLQKGPVMLEHQDKTIPLRPVDPIANGHKTRHRKPAAVTPAQSGFEPLAPLRELVSGGLFSSSGSEMKEVSDADAFLSRAFHAAKCALLQGAWRHRPVVADQQTRAVGRA